MSETKRQINAMESGKIGKADDTERLDELGEILAGGLLRMNQKKCGLIGKKALELSAAMVLSVPLNCDPEATR